MEIEKDTKEKFLWNCKGILVFLEIEEKDEEMRNNEKEKGQKRKKQQKNKKKKQEKRNKKGPKQRRKKA